MKHNEVTNRIFVRSYEQRHRTENTIANNEQCCIATDVSLRIVLYDVLLCLIHICDLLHDCDSFLCCEY